MLPLFDLMMQAQNGTALEAFSKQFGLAQEQATKAFAALMPAFSTGLKRSAATPYDFGSMMQSLMTGNYSKYFEDVNAAFSPQGIAAGNEFMRTIFGPKEVSQAVAEQAAKVTGIGQDMLNAMMPAMASAMAGGIVKEMSGQFQSMTEKLTAANPMMGMMTQWMETAGIQPKPKKPEPVDNPMVQMMQMMQSMFGAMPAQKQTDPADPFGASAFMKMMQSFTVPPAAKPEPEAKPVDLSKYSEFVGSMFDSGLEVQKSYQKNMESIFDSYVKGLNGKKEG